MRILNGARLRSKGTRCSGDGRSVQKRSSLDKRGGEDRRRTTFFYTFRVVDPHFCCLPPFNLPRASSAEARSFSVSRRPPEGVDTPLWAALATELARSRLRTSGKGYDSSGSSSLDIDSQNLPPM